MDDKKIKDLLKQSEPKTLTPPNNEFSQVLNRIEEQEAQRSIKIPLWSFAMILTAVLALFLYIPEKSTKKNDQELAAFVYDIYDLSENESDWESDYAYWIE
jgi:type VI protein secretion system component VasF